MSKLSILCESGTRRRLYGEFTEMSEAEAAIGHSVQSGCSGTHSVVVVDHPSLRGIPHLVAVNGWKG
jgi:hypothetical protein